MWNDNQQLQERIVPFFKTQKNSPADAQAISTHISSADDLNSKYWEVGAGGEKEVFFS